MSIKEKTRLFAFAVVLSLTFPMSVNAAGSLDEVIEQQESVEQATGNAQVVETPAPQATTSNEQTATLPATGKDFADDLAAGTNFIGEQAEEVEPLKAALQKVGRIISQGIIIVIVFALPVFTLLDAAYIVFPPLRPLLSNGMMGTPIQGAANPGGVAGPMGSMGGAYGANPMAGGYGMRAGYGGMRAGYGMNGAPGAMNPAQTGGTGFCWVSQGALNAVATEQSAGKVGAAIKVYMKDSVIKLVVIPLLIFLFASGILTNLGFLLSDKLMGGIANLMAGM